MLRSKVQLVPPTVNICRKHNGLANSKIGYRSMKSWRQDNDIEMHSRHNEGKSVVAEEFIRT